MYCENIKYATMDNQQETKVITNAKVKMLKQKAKAKQKIKIISRTLRDYT